jgi:hypothetical protein
MALALRAGWKGGLAAAGWGEQPEAVSYFEHVVLDLRATYCEVGWQENALHGQAAIPYGQAALLHTQAVKYHNKKVLKLNF